MLHYRLQSSLSSGARLAALLLGAALLVGCNAFRGFGQDLESLGKTIQRSGQPAPANGGQLTVKKEKAPVAQNPEERTYVYPLEGPASAPTPDVPSNAAGAPAQAAPTVPTPTRIP